RKRQYLNLDINQLLADEGIDSNQLIPRHPDMENLPTIEKNAGAPLPVYLPLEVFDDEEFDCRIPKEWIGLGYEPGSCDRKPVPAKALLPVNDILGHEDPKSRNLTYQWCSVGVLDYDQQKKIYLVHKADVYGHVRDAEGNQILNGGVTAAG
ncbi:dynein heavy chain 1, axonemal-like, partial [Microcaecilia unicolor]